MPPRRPCHCRSRPGVSPSRCLPWSWLADRVGRLRAMKIAISTAAVAGLLVALSPGLESLLVVRFLEGVALGGLPALAMTYLHDEVHPRLGPRQPRRTYPAPRSAGPAAG